MSFADYNEFSIEKIHQIPECIAWNKSQGCDIMNNTYYVILYSWSCDCIIRMNCTHTCSESAVLIKIKLTSVCWVEGVFLTPYTDWLPSFVLMES